MKASNFRVKKNMSYARKEYMGGIPGSKIVIVMLEGLDLKNLLEGVI